MTNHRKQRKSQRRPVPLDPRPLPVDIPGRTSSVQALVNFYNRKASESTVQRDGAISSRPRWQVLLPVPKNKVKTLVSTYSEIESYPDPVRKRKPKARTRPTRYSSPTRLESKQFGTAVNRRAVMKDIIGLEDISEVSASGGDRREATYRKRKELNSFNMSKRGDDPLERRLQRRVPSLDGSESGDELEFVPKRHRRKRKRSKSSKYQYLNDSDYTWSHRARALNPEFAKDRALNANRMESQAAGPSGHGKWALLPDIPDERTSSEFGSGWEKVAWRQPSESNRIEVHPDRLSDRCASKVPITDTRYRKNPATDTSAGPKAAFLSGTLRSVRDTILGRPKEPAPSANQRPALHSNACTKVSDFRPQRSLHGKARGSRYDEPAFSKGSAGTGFRNKQRQAAVPTTVGITAVPGADSKPRTSANAAPGRMVSGPIPSSSDSASVYHPHSMRKPRSFKAIARERHVQRGRAAMDEKSAVPKVPPLRVVNLKHHGAVIDSLELPYAMSSQETLTSFERPEYDSTSSDSVYTFAGHANGRSTEPNSPISPTSISIDHVRESRRHSAKAPAADSQAPTYKPLRSPSLMREMTPPPLSLRIPKEKIPERRLSIAERPTPRRPVVMEQHFQPRMKIQQDDGWMGGRSYPERAAQKEVVKPEAWRRDQRSRGSSSGSMDSTSLDAPPSAEPRIQALKAFRERKESRNTTARGAWGSQRALARNVMGDDGIDDGDDEDCETGQVPVNPVPRLYGSSIDDDSSVRSYDVLVSFDVEEEVDAGVSEEDEDKGEGGEEDGSEGDGEEAGRAATPLPQETRVGLAAAAAADESWRDTHPRSPAFDSAGGSRSRRTGQG